MEKMGRELVWTPAQSMWTASFILLPIGIFLTYKAATDSALLNMEAYLKPMEKSERNGSPEGKEERLSILLLSINLHFPPTMEAVWPLIAWFEVLL